MAGSFVQREKVDMLFSILICSIVQRQQLLDRLMDKLNPQKTDEVEILVDQDNMVQPVWAKRNALVRRASGDYLAFIDDDDLVSDDYVSKILEAVKTSPDCCGIEGVQYNADNPSCPVKFVHSIRYFDCPPNGYDDVPEGYLYLRTPTHLSPIRSSIVKSCPFQPRYFEDMTFMHKIRGRLKTEVYIDGPIYFYDQRLSQSSRKPQ